MIKAGEIVYLKTTGEPVFVLHVREAPAVFLIAGDPVKPDASVFCGQEAIVRRGATLAAFLIEELEDGEVRQARMVAQVVAALKDVPGVTVVGSAEEAMAEMEKLNLNDEEEDESDPKKFN